jgi:hypothetical protein
MFYMRVRKNKNYSVSKSLICIVIWNVSYQLENKGKLSVGLIIIKCKLLFIQNSGPSFYLSLKYSIKPIIPPG